MTTCPRCGAPLVSMVALAEEARLTLRSLEGRRLALPDRVRAGLVVLAAALPCHAGTCEPKGHAP